MASRLSPAATQPPCASGDCARAADSLRGTGAFLFGNYGCAVIRRHRTFAFAEYLKPVLTHHDLERIAAAKRREWRS